ncbi:MAG: hypothetical protein GX345_01015 [Clostridiales bacterium]|nr:hypothetical protein [Clostridiales bacterium]
MKINKGAKIGIALEMLALVIMIIIALLNKPIPSVVSWIFVAGLVLALLGSLIALSKRNNKI